MSADANETIADIRKVAEGMFRSLCVKYHITHMGTLPIMQEFNHIFDRIEAAWKRQEQCYLDQIRDAVNMAGHEQYMREHAPICNAIINTWKYPLTNLGHRGNQNRGPKTPVSIVRDADGCVLMSFTGEPYRTNAEAIAMASEFCSAMNELHERVGNATTTGNAAAIRDALIEIRNTLKKWYCPDKRTAGRVVAMREKCEAAIAKPQRNCDFYDNKTDAETGFVEETGEDDREQHYWQMFANWLFWKAKGRKGGSDGK